MASDAQEAPEASDQLSHRRFKRIRKSGVIENPFVLLGRAMSRLKTTQCMVAMLIALITSSPEQSIASPDTDKEEVRGHRTLTSFAEQRDQGVIRQQRDYSCGAAALATLFVHQWRDNVSEADVLTTLSLVLREDELARRRDDGLSLLDLSRVARARGYQAQGFRLYPEQLAKLTGPVIVFIDPDGYEHFSVLKGIVGNRAYLADPSHGNVSYPLYHFLDMWTRENGTGFILAVAPLYLNVTTHSPGELAPSFGRSIEPALKDVQSQLPFSILDAPTQLP